MKKYLILILFLNLSLFGENFTPSKVCKACHPLVYKEYVESMHYNSSIFRDKIHKKIFSIHPLSKKEKYQCAKCHTPTDEKLLKDLNSTDPALPKIDSQGQKEAISCAYCHRIKDIKKHAKMNENIINSNQKYFFAEDENIKGVKKYTLKKGLFAKQSGSPYHTIDATNPLYKNAKVCMGCHSHKQNKNGFTVCKTEFSKDAKQNCITCHMPKVSGSFANHIDSKTHRYHGFAGVFNKPEFLEKYIELTLKTDKNIEIEITNLAPHKLFLHPLRAAAIKISVTNAGRKVLEDEKMFSKIFGKNGTPAPVWEATEVLQDTILNAKESTKISLNYMPKKGDNIKIEFGYYIVNPGIAKKLNLEEFSKFKVLKTIENKIYTNSD
ncbi:multiheme c-type cytochrome [Nitrosophilus alvini]|uniref:multiheme c-type cytochrome n=1 Tax=Nitrosophilus alvini TaxID=2714855 RepID=UPI00190D2E79|nr:multiheme c-type cytochrome [Nitrosophilus alvini]